MRLYIFAIQKKLSDEKHKLVQLHQIQWYEYLRFQNIHQMILEKLATWK